MDLSEHFNGETPEALEAYLNQQCQKYPNCIPYGGFNFGTKIIFVPDERVRKSFKEFQIRIEKYVLFSNTEYVNPFFDYEIL